MVISKGRCYDRWAALPYNLGASVSISTPYQYSRTPRCQARLATIRRVGYRLVLLCIVGQAFPSTNIGWVLLGMGGAFFVRAFVTTKEPHGSGAN